MISPFIDHELDGQSVENLRGHLASCPTCPPLYASVVAASAALSKSRDPDDSIPANLAKRIRKYLATQAPPEAKRPDPAA